MTACAVKQSNPVLISFLADPSSIIKTSLRKGKTSSNLLLAAADGGRCESVVMSAWILKKIPTKFTAIAFIYDQAKVGFRFVSRSALCPLLRETCSLYGLRLNNLDFEECENFGNRLLSLKLCLFEKLNKIKWEGKLG